ncbi:hypothetical protein CSV86_022550 [Pseudomonas putida CSV86]|uniref:Uncharacterized protein n=1 Tax=Pseudomonas bharatica CSV86 TaxID=1005395 RepID=L1M1C7_9PSED|nr:MULTISPECIES: hypothetical protein [Pseudomonas]MDG9881276.1 hypothetical protein [Pseudomonas sp. GD04058]NNJ17761.1 hypothetical protein [Pseudomonas bharatica CSV86]
MTQDTNQPLDLSSAAVVESSLLAFGAGMTAQNRQDVKNSYLFASLVANKRHNQLTLSEAWFDYFLEAMTDCGWAVARRTHEKASDTAQSLKLSNVAVQAVQVAASSLLGGGPVVQALGLFAEKAIDGLGKNEEALTLFKRSLYRQSNVMVGVASCIETKDGEVVMALGAIQRTVRKEDLDTVLFDWDSNTSATYRSTAALSFNTQIYAKARDLVEQRLGERAVSRIMDYDI